jgi:cytochrome c-type biogenesis protein CcmH
MSAKLEHLKKQLRQLDDLIQSGTLADAQAQEARVRLERQLVDAVMAGEDLPLPVPASTVSPPLARSKVPASWVVGMTAFVLAVGAGGYAWLGNPEATQAGPMGSAMAPQTVQAAASAPHSTEAAQILAMTESLATKLKADPQNPEGWAMLARSYAVLGRYEEATAAYKKALALRPEDARLHADLADALAVTQGRKLDGEPARLVAKSLSLDPANFKGLSLAGTIAFEKQDFKGAVELWTKALKNAPPDNPDLVRQMTGALEDARQRAGLPSVEALKVKDTSAVEPVAASGAEVSGRVSLSKALAGKVSPEDTVFVFARAAQGPRMPLAILRKQVKDLPANFKLTDALAMSPQMKLSGFQEVVVGARVSRSGQAMPQPGDWQGQSGVVKLGDRQVQVEISEAVR